MIFRPGFTCLSFALGCVVNSACSAPGNVAPDSSNNAIASAPTPSILREPTGPYEVGIRDYYWVDDTRAEIFTKDKSDHRRLKITALYPTAGKGSSSQATPRAPYVSKYEFPEQVAAVLGSLTIEARTDAPALAGDAPLPVLVYNHGANTYRMTGSFMMLELASRGYVVLTIEHPGSDFAVKFAEDEPPVAFDDNLSPALTQQCDDEACITASETYYQTVQLPEWIKDNRYVLAKVTEGHAAGSDDLFRRIDPTRVGAFGWSLGGSTSIQMTLEAPNVVIAAIDYDGGVRGSITTDGPGKAPLMLMHASGTWDPGKVGDPSQSVHDAQRAAFRKLHAAARGPIFDYTVTNSAHGTFSDSARMTEQAAERADVAEKQDAIVKMTVAFFDAFIGRAGAPPSGTSTELESVASSLPTIFSDTRPSK